MSKKKPRTDARHPFSFLARKIDSDDGSDPRNFSKPESDRENRRPSHRDRALCRQVEVAIRLTLQGELSDPLLQQLDIVTVEPAPDSRRLRVVAEISTDGPAVVEETHRRLQEVSALLRQSMVEAIHRRRAPELIFLVLPRGEVRP